MIYKLEPYVRVGPIRFGMKELDLLNILGNPIRILENRRGEKDYHYQDVSVRFSKDQHELVEVGLLKTTSLIVESIDVFQSKNAFSRLIELDNEPFEYVGFIVFFKFGLALTGFHAKNESEKAATVFSKYRWDHLRSVLKSFYPQAT